MKRLLWKEFRERRLWALLWAASILGCALFGHGQSFRGEHGVWLMPWMALPLLLALLLGAGAYASELTGERATFVFSRPVAWWRLLLAKLIFAAVIIIAATLLAALLYRLSAPAPYRHLATASHLLAGAWGAAWKLGVLYLFGLACSVVLPGAAGGVLTAVAITVVLAALYVVAPILELSIFSGRYLGSNLFIGIFSLGAWAAALCAALPVLRFGLTLSTDERVKRYALAFAAVLLIIGISAVAAPALWADSLLRWTPVATTISPGGKYALVEYEHNLFGLDDQYCNRSTDHSHIIRLADGADMLDLSLRMNALFPGLSEISGSCGCRWVSDETAYSDFTYFDSKTTTYHYNICILHPAAQSVTPVVLHDGGQPRLRPSPDGKWLLAQFDNTNTLANQPHSTLSLIDLQSAHSLEAPASAARYIPGCLQSSWWQSNEEIGYLDSNSKRHFISAPWK